MICEHCKAEFDPPARNPRRRSCSRRCAAALSWRANSDRGAAISLAQKRRSQDISQNNRRRWARPGEREKLAERNRLAWADPATRARISAAIRRAHSTPEKRQFYSDLRRAMWRDPVYRARVSAIVAASHRTEEYRALFSALLRERWQDPVWREKWIAGTRRRYAKAPQPAEPVQIGVVSPNDKSDTPRHIGGQKRDVSRSAHTVTASNLDRRSPQRIAEEEAIAAFLAEKGVTVCPPAGSDELRAVPLLVWSREKRRFVRDVAETAA